VKLPIAALVLSALVAPPAQADTGCYSGLFDLGFPDGVMASFAYQAHPRLSPHVGLGHNANSLGLRVGGRWTFVDGGVAPYLGLESGHYFQAQTPDWMRETAKSAGLEDKTLDRAGYTFANAHLGVSLGSGKLRFHLQTGISFVRANTLIIKPKPNYTPPVDLYRDTRIHAWLVSGRAGVGYYF
jgi:hypothetical protein